MNQDAIDKFRNKLKDKFPNLKVPAGKQWADNPMGAGCWVNCQVKKDGFHSSFVSSGKIPADEVMKFIKNNNLEQKKYGGFEANEAKPGKRNKNWIGLTVDIPFEKEDAMDPDRMVEKVAAVMQDLEDTFQPLVERYPAKRRGKNSDNEKDENNFYEDGISVPPVTTTFSDDSDDSELIEASFYVTEWTTYHEITQLSNVKDRQSLKNFLKTFLETADSESSTMFGSSIEISTEDGEEIETIFDEEEADREEKNPNKIIKEGDICFLLTYAYEDANYTVYLRNTNPVELILGNFIPLIGWNMVQEMRQDGKPIDYELIDAEERSDYTIYVGINTNDELQIWEYCRGYIDFTDEEFISELAEDIYWDIKEYLI